MGVGKSMKIFMEGVQNSMNSTSTGGKILNTPMGPFAWNDTLQMWVNTNNGFSMPNISMQDMLAIGYDTLSGSGVSQDPNNNIVICNAVLPQISPTTLGMPPLTLEFFPGTITSPSVACTALIYVTDDNVGGAATHQLSFSYTIDGNLNTTSFTPLPSGSPNPTTMPFANGASLGGTVVFRVASPSSFTNPGTYTFIIKNVYDDSIIGNVTIITTNE